MSIPPLEEQEGFEEFTDTPRQKRVRARLRGDSKEEKMKDRLLEIADLVTRIPAALLTTKEGVGVAAILLGTGLKELGLTTGIDLWPFDRSSTVVTAEGIEKVIENPISKLIASVAGFGVFSSTAVFLQWLTTPGGKALLQRVFPDRPVEEISPEEKETIRLQGQEGNFGFIPVADALIWGGFLALTAEAIKGIGEVIPL